MREGWRVEGVNGVGVRGSYGKEWGERREISKIQIFNTNKSAIVKQKIREWIDLTSFKRHIFIFSGAS